MNEITAESSLADDITVLGKALAGACILLFLYGLWCWIVHITVEAICNGFD